jgi:uncharacterized protein YkwD
MRPRRSNLQLRVEALESRYMAGSIYEPTDQEQLFLELLNMARANPAAYGASIGLDLSNVAPSMPLAFNLQLMQAARLHSQDMSQRDFFGHVNPDGLDPGDRIDRVGYDWKAYGESLAAGYDTPADALRALIIDEGIPDLGHRKHLLSIDSVSATLSEVGIGIVNESSGIYDDYYTIDSARDYFTSSTHDWFLTGVVYNDLDANDFYSPGEGYAGLTVRATAVGGGAEFTTTTFCSGGYTLELPAGAYDVTVSGGSLNSDLVANDVSIGSANAKQDFVSTDPGFGSTCSATPVGDELAVWSGTWQVDANGNQVWDGTTGGDRSYRFGSTRSDVPVPIDWNGDGMDDLAVFRKGRMLMVDANGNHRTGRGDVKMALGNGGDQALVGDWTGSGRDQLGVLRNEDGTFHLDTNGDRRLDAADARFAFGPYQPGDVAIVGDWDGDGTDDVGLFRGGNTFMLDSNGDRTWDAAVDSLVTVAMAGARPAVAEFTGDARTDIAVFSGDSFHIDTDYSGSLDLILPFRSGAAPVPGNWV